MAHANDYHYDIVPNPIHLSPPTPLEGAVAGHADGRHAQRPSTRASQWQRTTNTGAITNGNRSAHQHGHIDAKRPDDSDSNLLGKLNPAAAHSAQQQIDFDTINQPEVLSNRPAVAESPPCQLPVTARRGSSGSALLAWCFTAPVGLSYLAILIMHFVPI
eukprot:SAG11_NODE_8428_length_1016_cov_1.438386_2_plen_159_part_01